MEIGIPAGFARPREIVGLHRDDRYMNNCIGWNLEVAGAWWHGAVVIGGPGMVMKFQHSIVRSRDGKCKPIKFDETDVSSEWPTESESLPLLLDDSWLGNLPLERKGPRNLKTNSRVASVFYCQNPGYNKMKDELHKSILFNAMRDLNRNEDDNKSIASLKMTIMLCEDNGETRTTIAAWTNSRGNYKNVVGRGLKREERRGEEPSCEAVLECCGAAFGSHHEPDASDFFPGTAWLTRWATADGNDDIMGTTIILWKRDSN
ncbi:unnamed protein product [Ilex paraguariensis]|uniref:Uncharacterized protein n=1 Tax=Ilex paraguariensis TaxID=185542 RepID=A0ABC8SXX0_9AQUA